MKLIDRVIDRLAGKTTAVAYTCKCVPNPAICSGGHEYMCYYSGSWHYSGCC